MTEEKDTSTNERLAEQVRDACFNAAVEAYEEAKTLGLCHEGALDYALDAMKRIDLNELIHPSAQTD